MNGRKIVRGFLWMLIVPLAVSAGLWVGQAWSQGAQPTELDVRIGALNQSYKGQVANAAEREATLTSELAATRFAAENKAKADAAEIERLKKLCGDACAPKAAEDKKP